MYETPEGRVREVSNKPQAKIDSRQNKRSGEKKSLLGNRAGLDLDDKEQMHSPERKTKSFRVPPKISFQCKVPPRILGRLSEQIILVECRKHEARVHRNNQRALHGHVRDHDELIECVDAWNTRHK